MKRLHSRHLSLSSRTHIEEIGCGGATYDPTAEEAGTDGQGLAGLAYWASPRPAKGLSQDKDRQYLMNVI